MASRTLVTREARALASLAIAQTFVRALHVVVTFVLGETHRIRATLRVLVVRKPLELVPRVPALLLGDTRTESDFARNTRRSEETVEVQIPITRIDERSVVLAYALRAIRAGPSPVALAHVVNVVAQPVTRASVRAISSGDSEERGKGGV